MSEKEPFLKTEEGELDTAWKEREFARDSEWLQKNLGTTAMTMVDISKSARDMAIQHAHERFEKERQEDKKERQESRNYIEKVPLSGWERMREGIYRAFNTCFKYGKSFLKYTVGKQWVIGHYTKKRRDWSREKGKLYDEGGGEQDILDRFVMAKTEDLGLIDYAAGEKATELKDERADEIKSALMEMASKINNEKLSRPELDKIQEDWAKKVEEWQSKGYLSGKTKSEDKNLVLNNLLEVGQQMEVLRDHKISDLALKKYFEQKVSLTFGEARAGLRTKEQMDETTAAILTYGGLGAAMVMGAKRGISLAIGVVGAGAGLGAVSGWRGARRNWIKDQKERALSGEDTYADQEKARTKFEKMNFGGKMNAEAMIEKLDSFLDEDGNLVSDINLENLDKLQEVVNSAAEVTARMKLSGEKKVDLISFKGMEGLEKARTELLIKTARVKAGLKAQGEAVEEMIKSAIDLKEGKLKQEISGSKWALVKHQLGQAVISGTIGAIFAAFMSYTTSAIREKSLTNNEFLRSANRLFGRGSVEQGEMELSQEELLKAFEKAGENRVQLVDLDSDGDLELINANGDVLAGDLKFDGGKLTPESIKILEEQGFEIKGRMVQGGLEFKSETVDAREYIRSGGDGVKDVVSRTWGRNGDIVVREPVLSADGQEYIIKIDIRNENLDVDVSKLRFAFTATGDTQNSVMMVDMDDVTREVRISVDSTEASFLRLGSDGRVRFAARFGEVMEELGNGNVKVYSTVGGPGVNNLRVGSHVMGADIESYTLTRAGSSEIIRFSERSIQDLDYDILWNTHMDYSGNMTTLANGEQILDIDIKSGYNRALDQFYAGSERAPLISEAKLSSVNFGTAVDLEIDPVTGELLNQVEVVNKVIEGIATTPEVMAEYAVSLGLRPEVDTMVEFNELVDQLRVEPELFKKLGNETIDAFLNKMEGGKVTAEFFNNYTSGFTYHGGVDDLNVGLARNVFHEGGAKLLRFYGGDGENILANGTYGNVLGLGKGEVDGMIAGCKQVVGKVLGGTSSVPSGGTATIPETSPPTTSSVVPKGLNAQSGGEEIIMSTTEAPTGVDIVEPTADNLVSPDVVPGAEVVGADQQIYQDLPISGGGGVTTETTYSPDTSGWVEGAPSDVPITGSTTSSTAATAAEKIGTEASVIGSSSEAGTEIGTKAIEFGGSGSGAGNLGGISQSDDVALTDEQLLELLKKRGN